MRQPTGQDGTNQPANHGTPYIDPTLGITAYREAVAVIRAVAAADAKGAEAILTGTDAPRHVSYALAVLTTIVCRRGGLDDTGITALLSEISSCIFDHILDQPRPEAPPKE